MTLSILYITNDLNVLFLNSKQKQKPYGIISRRKKKKTGRKKSKTGRKKSKKGREKKKAKRTKNSIR